MASAGGILDLAEVDTECDLVANFQSNLQFDKHVANICANANRIVGIIKHTFTRKNIEFCLNQWSDQYWSTVQEYGALILMFQLERLNKSSVGLLSWKKI